MRKKVLAISGSTRKNSTNESILAAIAKLYSNELDVQIYNQIDKLPYFNPDMDKGEDEAPGSVKTFREKIDQSDAVIICTPEYVFSLPGALKNALEWTVSTTVFSYKPFAFIVASASGVKAFESLDLIMSTLLQTKIDANYKLLIRGSRGKINEAGEFSDEKTLTAIKKVVDSLIEEITKRPPDYHDELF